MTFSCCECRCTMSVQSVADPQTKSTALGKKRWQSGMGCFEYCARDVDGKTASELRNFNERSLLSFPISNRFRRGCQTYHYYLAGRCPAKVMQLFIESVGRRRTQVAYSSECRRHRLVYSSTTDGFTLDSLIQMGASRVLVNADSSQ